MVKHISERVTLSNGVEMPWLGLGVYKAQQGGEVERAIQIALDAGYRSIDTATLYENEEGVGRAIRETDIPREDIFITTKVWNTDQGYDSTLMAFEQSRKKLGVEYVDLYLVHWPVKGLYKKTWKALEKLYKEGYVRAIGVSNFHIHHLQDVIGDCEFKPMVNQVELHPWLTQVELRDYCAAEGIQVEAWRPLTKGEIFDEPVIRRLAEKYGKTPAQIILRWNIQSNIVTIPKSVTEHRIRENGQIFDFELSEDDMSAIDGLNQNKRLGADPDNFDF